VDGRRLEKEREVARGHPLRDAILSLLDAEELTAPELRSALETSPTAISYHLGILQRAELVRCVGGVWRLP